MDLPQMIDFIDWQVHFFDFAILGALQTDRFGNINTVCVGDHARPRLRGPGTVGISALCGLSRRFYILMTRHDRGAFVSKVDFICGAGFLDGGTSRARPRTARRWTPPRGDAARRVRLRAREQGDARSARCMRALPSMRCVTIPALISSCPWRSSARHHRMPRNCSCCDVSSTPPVSSPVNFPGRKSLSDSHEQLSFRGTSSVAARPGAAAWWKNMWRRSPPRSTRTTASRKSSSRSSAIWVCCSSGYRRTTAALAAT